MNNDLIKEECNLIFNNLNLEHEKLELVISELGEIPSLYKIIETFYNLKIYRGLDLLYNKFEEILCQDWYMESIFLNLAKNSDEEGIDYFFNKNKKHILYRDKFDRFSELRNSNELYEVADWYFDPIFNEGLKALCTKKKVHILKKAYKYGLKASLSQLKVATRTLNEDVFLTVLNELNSEIISDYVPMLVEELCTYSKLEPIAFLFEKIGIDYIDNHSLNKSLINSVNGNSKVSKLEIFKYILELGADIKYDNYKVFENIFGYNHVDILEYLYSRYEKFDNDNNYDLKKYIELSIQYDKPEIIKWIIDNNKYFNDNYNLVNDKELIVNYCENYTKHRNSLSIIISELFSKDYDFINELKSKYPKLRKLNELLNNLL